MSDGTIKRINVFSVIENGYSVNRIEVIDCQTEEVIIPIVNETSKKRRK